MVCINLLLAFLNAPIDEDEQQGHNNLHNRWKKNSIIGFGSRMGHISLQVDFHRNGIRNPVVIYQYKDRTN
ncbi:hypothetical protein D3C81_1703950 [compost metagenome]